MKLSITQEHVQKAYREAKPNASWAIHSNPIKLALEAMGYEKVDVYYGEIRSCGTLIGSLSEEANSYHLAFLQSASGKVNLSAMQKAAKKELATTTSNRTECIIVRDKKFPRVGPVELEIEIDEL